MTQTVLKFTQSATILTLGFLFASCEPPPESKPPSFTIKPKIEQNSNPQVPLAGVLFFDTDESVTTTIHIQDGKNEWQLEYDEAKDPEQGLPVIGLRLDREHTINVTIQDNDGNQTSIAQPLSFTSPPLPEGNELFPPIDVTVNKSQEMEPGITLLSVRRNKPYRDNLVKGDPKIKAFNQNFGMLLAIDNNGEPIWYYRQDSRISDFEVLENGNIIYLTQDFRALEIDWLGNTVNTWWATGRPKGETPGIPINTDSLHHDIYELPDGKLAVLGTEQRPIENYYTSETDPNAPRKTQQVIGDKIIEFQRDGEVTWEWNTFDHLDPFRIGYETFSGYWERRGFPNTLDWTHANNLVYDPKEDSWLISLRYQSAIVKVNRSTGEFDWILGEPSGWNKELQDKLFTLEGDGRWFYFQHSPTPTPHGNFLVYDNGTFGARPFEPPVPLQETYSRVVEYELDEENMIAKEVWTSEIPGEEKVVTFAVGAVDWLKQTSNVLVSYGYLVNKDHFPKANWENILSVNAWTRVREFKYTQPAEIVWEVVMDTGSGEDAVGWIIFTSERVKLPALKE